MIRAPIRHHALVITTCILYLIIGYLIAMGVGESQWYLLTIYTAPIIWLSGAYFFLFFISFCLYHAFKRPEGSLWRTIFSNLTKYLTFEHFSKGLVILLVLPIFMSTFTSLKSMIPLLSAFSWDKTLSDFDKFIHFGYYPYQLLQPFVGHPLITTTLNFFYHLWFFILYSFILWQAFFTVNQPFVRKQFFLSFVLCWIILGTGVALLFSSAGPCYFTQVTGLASPYAPLFSYLFAANDSYPVWALTVQKELWDLYKDETVKLGSGIAAMPSMHVSVAMLFALTTRSLNTLLYRLFLGFLIVIFIGSVHLGWHYAIDGYVAIIGTLGIWVLAGKLIQAWHGPLLREDSAQAVPASSGAQ